MPTPAHLQSSEWIQAARLFGNHLLKVSTSGDAIVESLKSAQGQKIKLAVGSHQVEIHLLAPHPCNASIYGEDEDISQLVESVRASGWIKPLVVTPDYIIISGHRRLKAALKLGWEMVPVEVREFENPAAELEALLLENESRHKTTEQKAREAKAWKDIESQLASIRKSEAGKSAAPGRCAVREKKDVENFPRLSQGKTRDALAARVGLGSGKTYEKAVMVVERIDELMGQGNKEAARGLRKVLNEQSVDAAYKLVKHKRKDGAQVLELIARGIASTTNQAEKLVRQSSYYPLSSSSSFFGFNVGDWVEVSDKASPHHGARGRVDLIVLVEERLSVMLEDVAHCMHFFPQELTLIAKAPPPCPFALGDLVRIDRVAAVEAANKKYQGLWGIVLEIGELGSVMVDVGRVVLQLLPFDLKPIDAPSSQLKDVAVRVLRLRKLELDEIEEKMLDVLQVREWFTSHQLIYLKTIEKLYAKTVPMKRTS
jgi:ParB/RepB/Spo0J family partition protein